MATVGGTSGTRRTALAGMAGGLAALAVRALGEPDRAEAANGAAVKAGGSVSATAPTVISSSTDAIRGITSGGSTSNGVYGKSTKGRGVTGAGSVGVLGSGGTGVQGITKTATGAGVVGNASGATGRGMLGYASATSGATIGVSGVVDSPQGIGVRGKATGAADGIGVRGEAMGTAGIGVQAAAGFVGVWSIVSGSNAEAAVIGDSPFRGVVGRSNGGGGVGVVGVAEGDPSTIGGRFENAVPGGVALRVEGRAQFTTAGIVTIPASSSFVQVIGPTVPTGGLVLATLTSDPGNDAVLQYVDQTSFTIVLNKACTQACTVGYFILG